MSTGDRAPGWDKRAISRIAAEAYGGLSQMFIAHSWVTGDRSVSQVAPTRVVQTYGSVEAFVRSHERGLAGNALLDPRIAVISDEPDVWVSEFEGFSPETWGCVGFTELGWRAEFIEQSRPGALMVCYCETKGKRKVQGILQLTHAAGLKWDFISPEETKWARAKHEHDWNYAVKAIRAWKIAKDAQPTIEEFAPATFNRKNQKLISLRGMKLTRQEALQLLDLPLQEVPVWGNNPIGAMLLGLSEEVQRPSRPGPVSQSASSRREAEGPKHLYILRLKGDADAFLGKSAEGRSIVKVGFSVSPVTRLDAHNGALPKCAYAWELLHSTYDEGHDAFPSSKHALAGEKAMVTFLDQHETSLGGEFFLASPSSIERAWSKAIDAATNWAP